VRVLPQRCNYHRSFGSVFPIKVCRFLPGLVSDCRSLWSAVTRTRFCSPFSGRCTCPSFTSGKFGTAMDGRRSCSRPGSCRSFFARCSMLVRFLIVLIISVNLSFLNYVTIVPFLACFDDTFFRRILPRPIVMRAERAAAESEPSRINNTIAIGLSLLVAYLSIAPVANLISKRQMMNTSFDRLSLVNTYGAFGAVGKERDEIIFEGTDDVVITGDTQWKEYEFKAKPGNPNLRPPFIAPYQPRIDWQIWFAAMASPAE